MLVLYEILLFRGEGQSWLGMASGWGIKTLGTGFFLVRDARAWAFSHSLIVDHYFNFLVC
jgi:hypothetical protein